MVAPSEDSSTCIPLPVWKINLRKMVSLPVEEFLTIQGLNSAKKGKDLLHTLIEYDNLKIMLYLQ